MKPAPPEPTLEEMLADPIVQLVMKRDNVAADDVRRILCKARQAYLRRGGQSGLGSDNPDGSIGDEAAH